ncbi:MAG: DNA-processing protein DprA, partial [Amnibacterium sp.]
MSGLLGLGEAELHDAVAAVRPTADPDRALEAFARGAWTGLAEPGDGVAGAVTPAFGAAEALAVRSAGAPPSGRRELVEGFERWRPRLDGGTALRAFRNAAHLGIRLLLPGDDAWPAGLADLGVHAPLALWCLGDTEAVRGLRRSLALVGARAATGYGERVATDAGAGLADRGFAVVSGAAYGIDGTAHRAVLASGGTTVAVLAGGLDRFYPSGHEQLLRRIAAEGAVLAELPCGFSPTKWRFLPRNRLIAAMSRATVVLEAGARSGSLNTAGHAAALGRPLGAVPGSVYSATSAGCHRLLREYDAVCVRDAADMAELVAEPDAAVPLDGLEPAADPTERRVLDAL